eukprot:3604928-Lingulodinium_polyedra.AAC.1
MGIVNSPPAQVLYKEFKQYDEAVAVLSETHAQMTSATLMDNSVGTALAPCVQKAETQMAHARDGSTVQQGGRMLGNLTACQQVFRALQPGESRKGLIKRLKKCIERKAY